MKKNIGIKIYILGGGEIWRGDNFGDPDIGVGNMASELSLCDTDRAVDDLTSELRQKTAPCKPLGQS